jgi:hypothetical protein
MRCTSPVSFTSSTSTKDEVLGASVGGRESQTRGVTLSAPNSTVLLMGISRWEMRPVTLSRAANTAIGFLTISARAGSAARPKVSIRPAPAKKIAPATRRARRHIRCIIPHTF